MPARVAQQAPANPAMQVPTVAVVTAFVVALLAAMVYWSGDVTLTAAQILTLVPELAIAAVIVTAAGGLAWPIVRRLAGDAAPLSLSIVTACTLGLWVLSTAVLVIGSVVKGALVGWVWWLILAGGVAAALWQARGSLRHLHVPSRVPVLSLLWLLAALAAAVWLVCAAMPPGFAGAVSGDAYDVLEYHLQVPREFLGNGGIGPLEHNVFGFYPLGVEMLYLLSMVLRGGAYEGMYLAVLMHGVFAVLAVAGAAAGGTQRKAGLFSAILLAGVPVVAYLAGVAKTELAQVCCLVLALQWLRQWVTTPRVSSAVLVGAMVGAACATKYVAVGMVAVPVLVVMFALCGSSRRRWLGLAAAGLAVLTAASPWLIRNAVLVGNPIFPLAPNRLGSAHWGRQQQQRWINATAPKSPLPPVPIPQGWHTPAGPSAAKRFIEGLPLNASLGWPVMALAVGAIALLIHRPRRRTWQWALVAVGTIETVLWATMSHEMPSRFLTPIVAPLSLLGGWALSELAGNSLGSERWAAMSRWRGPAAVTVLILAGLFDAWMGGRQAVDVQASRQNSASLVPPLAGADVARGVISWKQAAELPAGSRLLLVGEVRAFYFPPGTIYATVFDRQPLAEMAAAGLSGEEVERRLREAGVTHVWVEWSEVWRLANTYGFDSPLSEQLFDSWNRDARLTASAPGTPTRPDWPVLSGLRVVEDSNEAFRVRKFWDSESSSVIWPVRTLYEVPSAR